MVDLTWIRLKVKRDRTVSKQRSHFTHVIQSVQTGVQCFKWNDKNLIAIANGKKNSKRLNSFNGKFHLWFIDSSPYPCASAPFHKMHLIFLNGKRGIPLFPYGRQKQHTKKWRLHRITAIIRTTAFLIGCICIEVHLMKWQKVNIKYFPIASSYVYMAV